MNQDLNHPPIRDEANQARNPDSLPENKTGYDEAGDKGPTRRDSFPHTPAENDPEDILPQSGEENTHLTQLLLRS